MVYIGMLFLLVKWCQGLREIGEISWCPYGDINQLENNCIKWSSKGERAKFP